MKRKRKLKAPKTRRGLARKRCLERRKIRQERGKPRGRR